MRLEKIGRIMLSFAVFQQALGSGAADLNETHVYNPTWPPHAIFHDIMFVAFVSGIAAIVIWLLWRKTLEVKTAGIVAYLFVIIYVTPFYWVTAVFPEASLAATEEVEGLAVHIGNIVLYPNALLGTIFLIIATIGFFLHRISLSRLKDKPRQ